MASTDDTGRSPRNRRWRLLVAGLLIALLGAAAGSALTRRMATQQALAHPSVAVGLGYPSWESSGADAPIQMTVINTGQAPFAVLTGMLRSETAALRLRMPDEPTVRPGESITLTARMDTVTCPASVDDAMAVAQLTLTVRSGAERTIAAPLLDQTVLPSVLIAACPQTQSPTGYPISAVATPDGRLDVRFEGTDGMALTFKGPDGTTVTTEPADPVLHGAQTVVSLDLRVDTCTRSLDDTGAVSGLTVSTVDVQEMALVDADPVVVTAWFTRKVLATCG